VRMPYGLAHTVPGRRLYRYEGPALGNSWSSSNPDLSLVSSFTSTYQYRRPGISSPGLCWSFWSKIVRHDTGTNNTVRAPI
jgi:hypothetical protein